MRDFGRLPRIPSCQAQYTPVYSRIRAAHPGGPPMPAIKFVRRCRLVLCRFEFTIEAEAQDAPEGRTHYWTQDFQEGSTWEVGEFSEGAPGKTILELLTLDAYAEVEDEFFIWEVRLRLHFDPLADAEN